MNDKKETISQQITQLKDLCMQANPNADPIAWGAYFDCLIEEIKSTLSPQLRHKLFKIDLNYFQDDSFNTGKYFFTGISQKSQKMLLALLEDELFYNDSVEQIDETYLRTKKLLEARRESSTFEENLAAIICGDNPHFPYRTSYYITKFFQENGFDYTHDGTTRAKWITSVLLELNIHDIYALTNAVFKKSYFISFSKDKGIDLELLIQGAQKEFESFIENSLSANQVIDLSNAFKLNINVELLYNKIADTEDVILNKQIETAKNFYMGTQKQEALEKLWDAFERLKSTLFPEDKKKSASNLITLISADIEESIFDQEFKTLTEIGNKYMIRHSEVGKIPINDSSSKDYLFFRMLALIDLLTQKIGTKTI